MKIMNRILSAVAAAALAAGLLAENWQQVVSTEDLVIYKRP